MNYDFVKNNLKEISAMRIVRCAKMPPMRTMMYKKWTFINYPRFIELKQRGDYEYEIDGMKFSIDLTKVKSSKTDHNRNPMTAINIIDSELSQQDETYEYEIGAVSMAFINQ